MSLKDYKSFRRDHHSYRPPPHKKIPVLRVLLILLLIFFGVKYYRQFGEQSASKATVSQIKKKEKQAPQANAKPNTESSSSVVRKKEIPRKFSFKVPLRFQHPDFQDWKGISIPWQEQDLFILKHSALFYSSCQQAVWNVEKDSSGTLKQFEIVWKYGQRNFKKDSLGRFLDQFQCTLGGHCPATFFKMKRFNGLREKTDQVPGWIWTPQPGDEIVVPAPAQLWKVEANQKSWHFILEGGYEFFIEGDLQLVHPLPVNEDPHFCAGETFLKSNSEAKDAVTVSMKYHGEWLSAKELEHILFPPIPKN